MSDPLAHSRLPDLPHAGHATRAQREVSDAIMFLIRGLERDRLLLLEVVCKGQLLFRKRFVKEYRAIKADSESADAVFGYLQLLAGPNPEGQKARLEQMYQHHVRQRWDRRLRTLMRLERERQDLVQDIVRESLKPKRVTVS